MTELNHEPETKSTNKARDLQDAIIRARRMGYDDPLSVARKIHDWFMEAAYEIQITILAYAITHLWTVVTNKMNEPTSSSSSVDSRRARSARLSPQEKARIDAEVKAKLDSKWVDAIAQMTGAQVRNAKKLPDEMAAKVGDNQRVIEVFTKEELHKVNHK